MSGLVLGVRGEGSWASEASTAWECLDSEEVVYPARSVQGLLGLVGREYPGRAGLGSDLVT